MQVRHGGIVVKIFVIYDPTEPIDHRENINIRGVWAAKEDMYHSGVLGKGQHTTK